MTNAEPKTNRAAGVTNAEKRQLLNVFVHDLTMDEVVADFDEGLMLTLHSDMLIKLQRDRSFYDAFQQFDLITCDSQILYAALKLMGTPVRERVSGSDYFPRFYMHHKDNPDVTVFLLGGLPGVADKAAARINGKVGREIIAGTYAPPFDFDGKPEEIDRIAEAVNASGATALLVGLGGGRQEKFIVAYRDRFPKVKLFLPLGGTIDYEAETLKRPAPWVTNVGLEWFYRVIKEPRQRWRRYFVEQPPVIWLLIKQKLGRYSNPFGNG
ncbi:WecB/TagA/CpsF family glycosyltransferase [Yoonia sp. R2331]|uniref:WecB/TagA/CpsF family glycosyltransferase n=1 Tax=Yoonia sp. R2331 TaxID=3237238 RepID=UPI0034E458BF